MKSCTVSSLSTLPERELLQYNDVYRCMWVWVSVKKKKSRSKLHSLDLCPKVKWVSLQTTLLFFPEATHLKPLGLISIHSSVSTWPVHPHNIQQRHTGTWLPRVLCNTQMERGWHYWKQKKGDGKCETWLGGVKEEQMTTSISANLQCY